MASLGTHFDQLSQLRDAAAKIISSPAGGA
jgi:hypothetical protein